MPLVAPAIFIRDFAGLANRLESLAIAYAIQARGGHSIVLDWPELDLLQVAGTQPGRMPWYRRPLRYKPKRIRSDADLDRAARRSTVDLRIFYGEAGSLDRIYPSLGTRLRLKSEAAQGIRNTFMTHAQGRPVVGVHVRRGDFSGADALRYDPLSGRHVAVPLWWHAKLMDACRRAWPGVRFFLSLNGEASEFPEIAGAEDVFTLGRLPGAPGTRSFHGAAVHAAADLFALACCPVILATPMSSFSHFAAHALGPPGIAVIPAAGATPDNCGFMTLRLSDRRLAAWNAACKAAPDPSAPAELPAPGPADTGWLI